jgi:hypothetical protein
MTKGDAGDKSQRRDQPRQPTPTNERSDLRGHQKGSVGDKRAPGQGDGVARDRRPTAQGAAHSKGDVGDKRSAVDSRRPPGYLEQGADAINHAVRDHLLRTGEQPWIARLAGGVSGALFKLGLGAHAQIYDGAHVVYARATSDGTSLQPSEFHPMTSATNTALDDGRHVAVKIGELLNQLGRPGEVEGRNLGDAIASGDPERIGDALVPAVAAIAQAFIEVAAAGESTVGRTTASSHVGTRTPTGAASESGSVRTAAAEAAPLRAAASEVAATVPGEGAVTIPDIETAGTIPDGRARAPGASGTPAESSAARAPVDVVRPAGTSGEPHSHISQPVDATALRGAIAEVAGSNTELAGRLERAAAVASRERGFNNDGAFSADTVGWVRRLERGVRMEGDQVRSFGPLVASELAFAGPRAGDAIRLLQEADQLPPGNIFPKTHVNTAVNHELAWAMAGGHGEAPPAFFTSMGNLHVAFDADAPHAGASGPPMSPQLSAPSAAARPPSIAAPPRSPSADAANAAVPESPPAPRSGTPPPPPETSRRLEVLMEAASETPADLDRLRAVVGESRGAGRGVEVAEVREFARQIQNAGDVAGRFTAPAEAHAAARPGGLIEHHDPVGYRISWLAAGGQGEAPLAFSTTNGSIHVDLSRR